MKRVIEGLMRPQFIAALVLLVVVSAGAFYFRKNNLIEPTFTQASVNCDFYVTTTGTPGGNGSSGSPWDLRTALDHPASVQPGDTICIRGGTYYGRFTSNLEGDVGQPIVVIAYPGERVTIDGNKSTVLTSPLSAHAATEFHTISVADPTIFREAGAARIGGIVGEEIRTDTTDSNPVTVVRGWNGSCPGGTCSSYPAGTVVQLWGNVIEVYGSDTIYQGLEVTISGQSTRVSTQQGSDPKQGGVELAEGITDACDRCKYINNVVHDVANGFGSHGSSGSGSEYYGNITYNNGWLDQDGDGYGHGMYIQNSSAPVKLGKHNITFHNANYGFQAYGDASGINNITFDSNIVFNNGVYGNELGFQVLVGRDPSFTNSVLQNNVQYGRNQQGTFNACYGGTQSINGIIRNNYIYGIGDFDCSGLSDVSDNTVIGQILIDEGQFPDNTHISNTPASGQQVFVFPNEYESGRAHVAVYNWTQGNTVNVDISSAGLTNGQTYEIRDAQNFYGSPIAIGTYSGSAITIPMNTTDVSSLIGNSPETPSHTSTQFGAFVILPTSEGAEDTTDPTVSLTAPANGATVSGSSVAVSANASDNVGVVGVQFQLDGNNLGSEDTQSPYTITWDTTQASNGSHSLTAVARDAAGNTTTSTARTVTVSNAATTAIRMNNSGEGVEYGSEMFDWDIDGATIMAWAYVAADRGADSGILAIRGGGLLYLNSNLELSIYTGEGVGYTNGTEVAVGEWHHYALVKDGADPTTWRAYIDGVPDISDSTSPPPGDVKPYFGNNQYGDWLNGRITAGKIWRAPLSQAEIQAEMGSYEPVRTADIWSVVPMTSHTDLADQSGQGNTPTAMGSLSTEEGPPSLSQQPEDTTPPVMSNGAPSGAQSTGTTSVNMTLSTDEIATCKYGTAASQSYASKPNTFSTTDSTSHSTTISGLTNGSSYTYYVRCQDSASNVNTSDLTISFSVSADTADPTVSLTAPANGATVSGSSVAVSANASDNVGVVGVQFQLDGNNLGSEDTQSPYTITWDTTQASNGSHSLTAVARDAAGNTTTSTARTVTVSNAVPSAPEISSFTATPTSITLGQSSTLSWSVSGATSLSINQGVGTVTGTSRSVSPTSTTTYTLSATNATGVSTAQATVTVNPPADITAPVRSAGSPTGSLAAGTTSANLSLTTDESATCKYGVTAGIAYASIANTFSTTGATAHSATILNLADGTAYNYYVRCQDGASNANTSDYTIAFSVASPPPPTQVATPSITPTGGSFTSTQSVTLATTTSGATIRYTTDGTNPSSSVGTVYSSAFDLSSTTTVKAIAYKADMTDSEIASAIFTKTSSSGGGGGGGGGGGSSKPPTQQPPASSSSMKLVNSNGTYYLIQSGQKKGVTSPGILNSCGFEFKDATAAASADNSLPSGGLLLPCGGALVKSSEDQTVYLISNNKRYAFTSSAVFLGLGFKFSSVLLVTNPELQALSKGSDLSSSTSAHLPDTDININGTIYWISPQGSKHPYPSLEAWNSWHKDGDFSTVVPANQADLSLPTGSVVPIRIF